MEAKFTYTDEELERATLAMIAERGQSQDDFADYPEEWEACVANAMTDLEAALKSLGGVHVETVLISDD